MYHTTISGNRIWKAVLAAVLVLFCVLTLSSCGVIHQTFSKKAEITFDANGGIVTGSGVETDGPSDPETYTAKCIVGDPITDFTASREYYDFDGWFTSEDGGRKVTKGPENDTTLYAHWESANKDRTVEITDIKISDASSKDGSKVRISKDDSENDLTVSFTLSKWLGQDVFFVNKRGEQKGQIDVGEDDEFSDGPITVTCSIPSRKWMDKKEYSYYVQSMENEHVDASEIAEIKIVLDGQYKDFNSPIEGSMVWYGGAEEAPSGRAGVILATDDEYVYARDAAGYTESTDGDESYDGSKIYKWKKEDVMINLADVRTDIVYDIYNAYSSKFFPIKGKAMYSDNGGRGLKRYDSISKDDAMHENRKTGKTTFMVPVQWDFAETVATAQATARGMGVTLYIVDSFRPMNSVGPVAKAVDNTALLAAGGTSAHNFGMAVDTGWQLADENGDPVGEPYVKNLQNLDKKKAVKGPHGNEAEVWWEGVSKLPQEWWHYGDTLLKSDFREHAKRVGSLYVNQHECASMKRSKM